MHHDIDHVFCDSFQIFNISQESSIDPYREVSFFRNLQIPQFKTTKASNQQWSNGWWDCFPKKSRSKARNSAFWGGKVWKTEIPSWNSDVYPLGFKHYRNWHFNLTVFLGAVTIGSRHIRHTSWGLVNSNCGEYLPNENLWEVLSVEVKVWSTFQHLNSWKFLQHDLQHFFMKHNSCGRNFLNIFFNMTLNLSGWNEPLNKVKDQLITTHCPWWIHYSSGYGRSRKILRWKIFCFPLGTILLLGGDCFFRVALLVCHAVDAWNPANQLRLVVCPIIYRVLYIPGG